MIERVRIYDSQAHESSFPFPEGAEAARVIVLGGIVENCAAVLFIKSAGDMFTFSQSGFAFVCMCLCVYVCMYVNIYVHVCVAGEYVPCLKCTSSYQAPHTGYSPLNNRISVLVWLKYH